MFGRKALKEEISSLQKRLDMIEGENWSFVRDNAQLEREKSEIREEIYARNNEIIALKKEKEDLEKKLNFTENSRAKISVKLTELESKKPTKEELIEQLAELLLNENRGGEKDNLIQQMNQALRINNTPPVPEGVVCP